MSAESSTFGEEFVAGRDADDEAIDILSEWVGSRVIPTDAGREGEKRLPETPIEALEWSHVDALVFIKHVSYALGMRVRPYDRDKRDLSIRVTPRSGEGDSEFDHVLRAMETGGIVPRWYVFALKTPPVVRDLSGVVIRHLFVIDARAMWRELDAGDLEYDGPRPSDKYNPGDDSEAIYVSIDDLRDLDLIDHEVHQVEW